MPPVSPFRRIRAAASEYRRARPAALNFEDLLRPQVEYLYRLAWRFTGSVADAEDLVQDVLIKLFPRTQELLDIEKLRPWLARVLYHQYIDSVRQRYYASLPDMPVPLSKQNFNTYGASTTPTLVILNRAGQVATYHPGAMPYEDLRTALEKASVR